MDCPICGEEGFDGLYGTNMHTVQMHDENIMKVDKECKECGDTFSARRGNTDNRTFCSKDCQGDWMSKHNTGEDHWTADKDYPYTGKEHHSYNSEIVNCEACGNELERNQRRIRINEMHFCDYGCQGEWRSENNVKENHPRWKGGHIRYGSGWHDNKKEEIRSRDGYECVACGMTNEEHLEEQGKSLEVHHIRKARKFEDKEKAHDPENLITLCKDCHVRWEGVPLKPVRAD